MKRTVTYVYVCTCMYMYDCMYVCYYICYLLAFTKAHSTLILEVLTVLEMVKLYIF